MIYFASLSQTERLFIISSEAAAETDDSDNRDTAASD